jgi:hypothetical protein
LNHCQASTTYGRASVKRASLPISFWFSERAFYPLNMRVILKIFTR